jgi:hypothetical protein
LIYEDGKLVVASTRGDGIEGENITHNAFHIAGIPREIGYKSRLKVVGESIIKLDDYAEYCEKIGDVTVRSFITPHDSEFSVGYLLEIEDEQGSIHKIGYATDLGYVTDDVRTALTGCESVVLESNHDRDMLLTGPYPYLLKERILSRYGHLSNEDCATLACELAEKGMRHLMLAHLSEQNNEPDIAYNETICALGRDDVDVCVAAPDRVVELCIGAEEEEKIC